MRYNLEKFTEKAEELIANDSGQSMDAKAYRGIGYALLAIAAALDTLATVLHNKGD